MAEANVQCENITVMQIDFSSHVQKHDLGWISGYLKKAIVWDNFEKLSFSFPADKYWFS